jgi:hypothetical protein
MSDAATVPAPADEAAIEVPPSSAVTPLARAALELGVDADDVLAYLVGRSAYRKSSDTFAAVKL